MIKVTENAPLLTRNTFGMDVRAALLAEYDNADELRQLLHDPRITARMQHEREAGRLPFWHIGGGSNLLFTGDYAGVIFHTTASGITESPAAGSDMTTLRILPATVWDDVCAYCASHGLYGPENLSLIPGEAGAAAVQNIGAYGVEIGDLIEEVCCWDVQTDSPCSFSREEMHYAYRDSLLKHPEAKARYVVTAILLRVHRTPMVHLDYAGLRTALQADDSHGHNVPYSPTAQQIRDAVIRIRRGKLPDPAELGNAGSFFKNPVLPNTAFDALRQQYPDVPRYTVDATHTKVPAGWLIEQCGWKGKALGRAGVYEKQSLVLVNLGGARPDELLSLCRTIIADVQSRFGITIEPEVNLI